MPPTPQTSAVGYHALWARAAIDPQRRDEAHAVARQILAHRDAYAAIEQATGVPLTMSGPVHYRESGLRFDRHLHCGDPLTARTVHVPKGRPVKGNPPFTFLESATDALTMPPHNLDQVKFWSVERILYETEKYNGWGYLQKGNSPYLWAGTSEYHGGKYVADHVYDPNAVDRQLGCVAIMKTLADLDPAVAALLARHEPVAPADVTADATRRARAAKAGGAVVSGGGAVGEAGNLATTSGSKIEPKTSSGTQAQPQPAPDLILTWIALPLFGLGLAIVLIAVVVERRQLAVIARKWSGV